MNIGDVFDKLLQTRELSMALPSLAATATPRISLLRKFKDYKQQMAGIGYLAADLENAVVSLEWNQEKKIATFFLRPRKARMVDYAIVEPTETVEATNESDDKKDQSSTA